MLFVCREVAGFEPAAGEAGIWHHSGLGVQSYQGPYCIQGVRGLYQALYRKWRPKTFDDVIGQEHITESLKNQVQTGHLSHAYIFIGTRGTGKTSCARILAKAVNCEHPVGGNPCLECPSCRAIADGGVMDIVELDAASNNGVDNVRALREEAAFSPASLKKRVYIIDEVHMLSTSAFNALLKILEEPPEHLLFVLATTELQKVPATILSRCQRHSFRRIDTSMLLDYLMKVAEKEEIPLEKEAAGLIASLAEGGVRDALSMLDQCSAYGSITTDAVYAAVGLAGNRRTMELFERICAHDTESAIALFHTLWADGKDPASLLRELSALVRDILMLKVAPRNAGELVYGGYDRAHLKQYVSQYSVALLSGTLEALQTALGNMRERLSPKMTAELCLISLCTELGGDSLAGLSARIAKLETAVANGIPHAAADVPHQIPSAQMDKIPAEPPLQEETVPVQLPQSPQSSKPIQLSEEEMIAAVQDTPDIPVLQESEEQMDPLLTADGQFWQKLCDEVRPYLPLDVQATLNSAARGSVDGEKLLLEVEPGFYYMRFNRPETLELFARTASELTGKKLTAVIRELKAEPKEPRSLDEFRKFPEVRFT